MALIRSEYAVRQTLLRSRFSARRSAADSLVMLYENSFSFTFVEPRAITASEQGVFAWTGEIAALAHVDLPRRSVAVLISETVRLNDAGSPVLGVWESAERLASGTSDGTLDFEQVLTELLGRVAATVLWRP
jgi:hypothetical protein